jgi:hypothetical protein
MEIVEELRLIGGKSGLGGLPKHNCNVLIIITFVLDEHSLVLYCRRRAVPNMYIISRSRIPKYDAIDVFA